MGAERRKYERHSLSGKIRVERPTSTGRIASMSVYLRDMSVSGFSGTYFGPTAPTVDDDLAMRHEDGQETPVRLVWSQKTLECIHMLGFEMLDGSGPTIAS